MCWAYVMVLQGKLFFCERFYLHIWGAWRFFNSKMSRSLCVWCWHELKEILRIVLFMNFHKFTSNLLISTSDVNNTRLPPFNNLNFMLWEVFKFDVFFIWCLKLFQKYHSRDEMVIKSMLRVKRNFLRINAKKMKFDRGWQTFVCVHFYWKRSFF